MKFRWSRQSPASLLAHAVVLVAAAAAVIVVLATGGSDSPYIPFLYVPIILAAIGCRFDFTIGLGVVTAALAVWMDGRSIPAMLDVMRGITLLGFAVCGAVYSRAMSRERDAMVEAVKQKEALLDASRIITASDDLESAVDSALQTLPKLVPDFRCAAIFLEDDVDGNMRLYDVIGDDREGLRFDHFDPNADDARWRPTDPAPLYVSDANSLQAAAVAQLDPRARSVLCLGLQSPRAFTSSVGMLYISSSRVNAFSNEQIGLLQEFADLIGFPLQKIRLQEGLQSLAFTDALTGLANYRYFRAELEEEVKRASRYRHPVSLIMLDLDHFKRVNDLHGHQVGDAALRWTAQIIRDNVRDADFPARYGGEEFAIICGETRLDEARYIAERIRIAVENRPLITESGMELELTVSAGAASFPENGPVDSDLIRAADDALYQAKRSGRNRVFTAEPQTEPERRTA